MQSNPFETPQERHNRIMNFAAKLFSAVIDKIQKDNYFLEQLKEAYDPHDLIINRVHTVSRMANEMIKEGYTDEEIYKLANQAREHWGLSPVTADAPLNREQ